MNLLARLDAAVVLVAIVPAAIVTAEVMVLAVMVEAAAVVVVATLQPKAGTAACKTPRTQCNECIRFMCTTVPMLKHYGLQVCIEIVSVFPPPWP